MNYVHFIITRFNLPIFKRRDNNEKVDNCNLSFLQERLEIFEKCCFPSIANQSCQNFKWLVLFDSKTPQVIKNRLSALHGKYKNLLPCYLDVEAYDIGSEVYVDKYKAYYKKLKDVITPPISDYDGIDYYTKCQYIIQPQFVHDMILRNIPSDVDYDYIVTTRLDNDDALHRDYVQTIQTFVTRDARKVMYNFLYGYQLNLNNGIVQKYYYPNSHFTTLVESKKDVFLSAFYGDHRFVNVLHEVVNISMKPMWCELLHGKNVANTISVSYKNRILGGYLSFRNSDFGYTDVCVHFKDTIRFLTKISTILSLLRSIKHGMLGL